MFERQVVVLQWGCSAKMDIESSSSKQILFIRIWIEAKPFTGLAMCIPLGGPCGTSTSISCIRIAKEDTVHMPAERLVTEIDLTFVMKSLIDREN